MKTLDRYIAVTLGVHFLYSLAILLAIFSIVILMKELRDVGAGDYGIREALWFVFLTLPNEAYKLIPAAALLGTVMGLGALASAHELVAINAAGVSPARLSRSALQAAAWAIVAGMALGEFVAAPLVMRAQSARSAAMSGGLALGTASGFWARDGSSFVNTRSLLPDGSLRDLYVFDFDEQRQMTRFRYAERAFFADGRWNLKNFTESIFSGDDVITQRGPSAVWESQLEPLQMSFLLRKPEDLSLVDLYQSIHSRRERSESSERERLAFWRRIGWPLVTAVMVYVGLPFVFGNFGRSTGGKRIAVGALVGVGFQMFNEAFGTFALAYGVDPRLCALLPGMLALFAALWAMRTAR